MRLLAQSLAVFALAASLAAQQTQPSPGAGAGATGAGQTAAPAQEPKEPSGELPVSLDRIRDGLNRPPQGSTLKNLDLKPDFIVRVEEKAHVEAILSKLDFKGSGPVPPGGLYAYEMQQQLGNKNARPLQQPYAAFSGKEMIVLAIEGIMQRYLGGKILDGLTSAQRASAERAAREEVAQAIASYCDARPDGGASLHLCTDVLTR
jgi:hypothetical protein